jgi:hypothetical protein
MQCSAIVASLVCLLVELFQLNARIAADPTPLIQGNIAPFEWAGKFPPVCAFIQARVMAQISWLTAMPHPSGSNGVTRRSNIYTAQLGNSEEIEWSKKLYWKQGDFDVCLACRSAFR